jgi:hypothetical protein
MTLDPQVDLRANHLLNEEHAAKFKTPGCSRLWFTEHSSLVDVLTVVEIKLPLNSAAVIHIPVTSLGSGCDPSRARQDGKLRR